MPFFDSAVYETLRRFFESYLTERNIEKTMSLTTESVFGAGSEEESAQGREQFAEILRRRVALNRKSVPYELSGYSEEMLTEETALCFFRVKSCVKKRDGRIYLRNVRGTAALLRTEEGFRIASLHILETGPRGLEGEFIPLRYVASEPDPDWDSQRELIEIICQTMPGGILGVYLEEGFPICFMNDNFLKMTGFTYEELLEETGGDASRVLYCEDRESVIEAVREALEVSEQYEMEYRIKRKDGGCLWVHAMGKKVAAGSGRRAFISIMNDISENIRARNHLLEENQRDPLTGIQNRRAGERTVCEALRLGSPYVLLIMDIDNFKALNDIYGHQEGDRVLVYTSQILTGSFRNTDIIFRLGGDEFVVFVQPCTNRSGIEKKLERLMREYRERINAQYPKSGSTLSFGGVSGSEAVPFSSLYRAADRVLYEVKNSKKGSFRIEEFSGGWENFEISH